MNELLIVGASALWLGVLTSLSPCPLATNIVAVSFISRRLESPYRVLAAGLAYTFGRMLTYLALAVLIVASLLGIPQIAFFLQLHMNRFLGPVLIVVGLLLLEIIPLPLRGSDFVQRVGTRAATWGHVGAVVLGMTFALSFCPVSAALFFGGLMPLAMKESSRILLPSLYGIGTGLPVLAVALLAATGFKAIGGVFRELSRVELWARRVTALVFAGVGIYYTLKYILEAFD